MNTNTFKQPVPIFVGLGFPHQVESVAEAHQILSDWPSASRDSDHAITLDACRSALAGDVDAETARAVFERFARRRGILAPEAMAASASQLASEWFNH